VLQPPESSQDPNTDVQESAWDVTSVR